MANARLDENSNAVGIAVDTNGVVKPLLIDPSTGRLLIEITIVTEPASPVLNTLKFDENSIVTAQGTGDDSSAEPIPLHIDNRNGLLFVDVLVE